MDDGTTAQQVPSLPKRLHKEAEQWRQGALMTPNQYGSPAPAPASTFVGFRLRGLGGKLQKYHAVSIWRFWRFLPFNLTHCCVCLSIQLGAAIAHGVVIIIVVVGRTCSQKFDPAFTARGHEWLCFQWRWWFHVRKCFGGTRCQFTTH